jgi:V/A-type H+-transporting ATPase subunit I
MIRAMRRVYLLYTQEKQDELVSRLQKLGLLHLEESRLEGVSPDGARPRRDLGEDRKRVESLLLKAHGTRDLMAEVLTITPRDLARETYPTRLEDLYQQLRDRLDPLEGRLKALVAERRELRDHLAAGERLADAVRVSEDLLRALPHEGYTFLPAVLVSEQRPLLAGIRQTLEREDGGRFVVAHEKLGVDRIELIVAAQPEYAFAASEYLEGLGVRPLALPSHVAGDFVEGVAQLKAEAVTIPRRLAEIDEELRALGREHATHIAALTHALENRLAQLEAAAVFGYTDYTLLITGWIPQDGLAGFQAALREEFPGIIIREEARGHGYDEEPVAFKEGRWARPYQLFMQAFGTPKAGTVDPIPTISIFFPIFFGLILGDVGYGLVVLALALWGLRGFPGLGGGLKRMSDSEAGREALTIMVHGGVFTVVLGCVFGEFFGLTFQQLGIPRMGLWPFSRVESAIVFLLVTVLLGAAQVTLGFIFGIVTAVRQGSRKHLVVKIGLFMSFVAFTLIFGRLMAVVPPALLVPGIVLLVLALPLLVYGGGTMVILESLSPFVHMISYARIMGFGVASVVLAELINTLAGAVGGLGHIVVGILLAAIVILVLQPVNLVLGVFEGTIQSVRLHWVEFFEKFLLEQLGGKPYRPFKEKEAAAEP